MKEFSLVILMMVLQAIRAQYPTQEPEWVTSNYFRAGNEAVINTLTGSSQTPTYTFTFSSPLTGIPNLGYGIKNYEGNDYFGQERFEVERLDLTPSTFYVKVQIIGVTNIWILNVPYIAIDPGFPHHLNSFDNVPVNYSAGNLVNITQKQSYVTTYSNTINYTQQASALQYREFSEPLQKNKILLFMTTLFILGTLDSNTPPLNPIDLHVNSEVLTFDQYKITVSLSTKINIERLHFSEIIFDQTDVESLRRYVIIAEQIDVPGTGMFIEVPEQFIDNFIMGITDFSTDLTHAVFNFNWEFATALKNVSVLVNQTYQVNSDHLNCTNFTIINNCTNQTNISNCSNISIISNCSDVYSVCVNITEVYCSNETICTNDSNCSNGSNCSNSSNCSVISNCTNITNSNCTQYGVRQVYENQTVEVFGIYVEPSIPNPDLDFVFGFNRQGVTIFYIMTWRCPGGYFFDLNTDLCTICLAPNCDICDTPTTCFRCDQQNNYFMNRTTGQCEQCELNLCGTCYSLYTCQVCYQNISYGVINQYWMSAHPVSEYPPTDNQTVLGLCGYCNASLNQFVNWNNHECQYCHVPQCINCSALRQCRQCNQAVQYFLNIYNKWCYHCSSIITGCLQCASYDTCIVCDVDNDWGISYVNPNICGGCNESCICDGYTMPWDNDRQECTALCGDGMFRLDEACDDGNLVDGDGCSSVCEVEEYYYCRGEPSLCFIDLNLTFYHSYSAETGCNSLVLHFQVEPPLPIFASDNILNVVRVHHKSISDVKQSYHQNGTIVAEIQYSADLLPSDIQVHQPFTDTLIVKYQPFMPPIYYSEEECEGAAVIEQLLLGTQVGSYIVLFSSLVSCKIVGLQLFGVLQLAYFSLADHQVVNIYLAPLLGFKTFNGYNIQPQEDTGQTPAIIQQLQLYSNFINNFNIMYILLVGQLLVSLCVLLYAKLASSKKAKSVGKSLLKQGSLTILVFSALLIGFGAGLHWKYANTEDDLYILSSVGLYTGLAFCVGAAIALQVTKQSGYGEFKNKFKDKRRAKMYMTLSLLYRLGIGMFIVLEEKFEEGSLLIMSLFLLYFAMVRPFQQKYQNARAAIMHCAEYTTLVVASYYDTSANNPLETISHSHTPAKVELGVIVSCMGISSIALVYQTIMFIKKTCFKSNKVANDAQLPPEFDKNNQANENISEHVDTLAPLEEGGQRVEQTKEILPL